MGDGEVNGKLWFLSEFKNRLLGCEKEICRGSITNMSKLELYSMYKFNLETECHLFFISTENTFWQ